MDRDSRSSAERDLDNLEPGAQGEVRQILSEFGSWLEERSTGEGFSHANHADAFCKFMEENATSISTRIGEQAYSFLMRRWTDSARFADIISSPLMKLLTQSL